jgi:CheY-like chemotaxis protein
MARILLASDDAMVSSRVGARQTLEAAGHLVYEAHDGPSTLAQLETVGPDVLVLDTALPVLDGFHVLAELRRNPRFRQLPVVMFSTLPRGLGSELARPYGVACFLSRPFRAVDIAAAVDYVLATARGEVVKPPAPTAAPTAESAEAPPRPVPLPSPTGEREAADPASGGVVELPPSRARGEGSDRRRHRA